MNEIYIIDAAFDYARSLDLLDTSDEFNNTIKDFIAGAKWMQERMEEIKLTENR